jgi:hypothetical protein
MKKNHVFLVLILLFLNGCSQINIPLSLHPDNPHYFLFRGSPVILIGSTEHYGAVLNLDFDYLPYFEELKANNLNVTRTFTGFYVEPKGAFKIEKNTLAPDPGKFICPWARSEEPGYKNGGNKFDLTKWDNEYFSRLKDFVSEAGKKNIVVELDLFSNIYDTIQWQLSPLYYKNNVNNTDKTEDWKEVLSLEHPTLLKIQEEMVRKIISELNEFDNLYYEICNEPYFGDTLALRQWEDHMTAFVAETEREYKYKHLISNNIQNKFRFVPEPRPDVSIYNFHYASPSHTVGANYHLNAVIGDNETGFTGNADLPYRREAWEFILAGGAIFNHLDYSFTAENEDGSFPVNKPTPGGGGRSFRFQMKTLVGFMNEIDYINMKPAGAETARIAEGDPGNIRITGLSNDNVIALYINGMDTLPKSSVIELNLPGGSYNLKWTDTRTGSEKEVAISNHNGGWINVQTGNYFEDIALLIKKK